MLGVTSFKKKLPKINEKFDELRFVLNIETTNSEYQF
jgi:hypothetical protein